MIYPPSLRLRNIQFIYKSFSKKQKKNDCTFERLNYSKSTICCYTTFFLVTIAQYGDGPTVSHTH